MKTFSQRLKKAMDERQITQSDLSSKTGIGKSSISQYLSGKNIPTALKMSMLADALDVPVNWLNGTVDEVEECSGVFRNLPVERAASLMGCGKQMVRQGLKNNAFPFGYAVLMPSGKYRYYISPKKFTEYTGIEI